MSKLRQRLNDASRSGVYRAGKSDAIEDAVRGTALDCARIGLQGVKSKDELLKTIARALAFPDWFGGNWDALEDCLGDLSWRPGEGHVVLFRQAQDVAADDLGVLLDVLASSAEYWAGRRKPFFAVFVDPGHSLALPDLHREKGN